MDLKVWSQMSRLRMVELLARSGIHITNEQLMITLPIDVFHQGRRHHHLVASAPWEYRSSPALLSGLTTIYEVFIYSVGRTLWMQQSNDAITSKRQ